jgi:hypothetical protein
LTPKVLEFIITKPIPNWARILELINMSASSIDKLLNRSLQPFSSSIDNLFYF